MSVQTEIKDLITAYEASQEWGDDRRTEKRAAAVGIIKGADLLLSSKKATDAERELIVEFKKRVGREVWGIFSWKGADQPHSVGVATPLADALARPQTRYDAVPGHPLTGVPQEALDAARQALADATTFHDEIHYVLDVEDGDFEPVAHAVLAAALTKMCKP